MRNTMAENDRYDDAIFADDVSDEALEAAADATKPGGAYTLGACTDLTTCPA